MLTGGQLVWLTSEVSRQLPVVCSDDQQVPLVGNADLRFGAGL